jgi:hypothetical protein
MSRSTRRFSLLLSVTIPFLAALCAGFTRPARAIDGGAYSMEVLVGGVPLQEYAARGTTYVEALEGREYSIRLTNRTGERVAVALSVDGLNSIDAKTTSALDAQKWILGPWESITLDGWQTSSSTARRFFFTSEKRSYGAWLGKTKNLGIVSAAVFREKRPQPVRIYENEQRDELRRSDAPREQKDEAARGMSAPAAPEPQAKSQRRLSDDLAATGIGRELGHDVQRVYFDQEPAPSASLELRYEYHDALVKLGVLPRPCPTDADALARREHSRGFSDYAPDPYR